ncbi:MAG: hypothetical protein U1E50_00335 [Caulobacteraceae bacterium]
MASRDELIGIMNAYLDSGVAKTESAVQASWAAEATENGEPAEVLGGIWDTATAIPWRHVFADAETGEAGCHASVLESDFAAAVSVRLKVEAGQVTQIERLVTRRGEAGVVAPHRWLEVDPAYGRVEPEGERLTRAELIAAAEAYFDAVEAHDGSNLAVTDDCNRIENGVQTTNNPAIGLTLGCKEGLKHLTYITKVRNRRYPVVDVERQLVWGLVVFDVPPGGTITMVVNGEKIVREQAPRTIRIAELFKVTGRMISDIEVVVRNGPIGAGDGWS